MKLILIIAMLGLAGCSHSILAKDCNAVAGEGNYFKCKNLKPLE